MEKENTIQTQRHATRKADQEKNGVKAKQHSSHASPRSPKSPRGKRNKTHKSQKSTMSSPRRKKSKRPQSPNSARPLSPTQERSVHKLSQPKRVRSKRFRLQKANSKSGFGSRSARDLFFGAFPTEGAKTQYLNHSQMDKKNAAQSSFKSKSFVNERVPFERNTSQTENIDLQHANQEASQSDHPSQAPFNTTEQKFKVYDYYHKNLSSTNEYIGPNSYFNGSEQDSARNSGVFIDLNAPGNDDKKRHPHAVAFQQRGKTFRSTNDVRIARPGLKRNTSSIAKVSQSTLHLPTHLVRSKARSRSNSQLSTPKSPHSVKSSINRTKNRRKKKKSSSTSSKDSGSRSLTPITPLSPRSEASSSDSNM